MHGEMVLALAHFFSVAAVQLAIVARFILDCPFLCWIRVVI